MNISNFWQIFIERILKQFEIKIILLFYLLEYGAVDVPKQQFENWGSQSVNALPCNAMYNVPVELPFIASWLVSPMFVFKMTKFIHTSSENFPC